MLQRLYCVLSIMFVSGLAYVDTVTCADNQAFQQYELYGPPVKLAVNNFRPDGILISQNELDMTHSIHKPQISEYSSFRITDYHLRGHWKLELSPYRISLDNSWFKRVMKERNTPGLASKILRFFGFDNKKQDCQSTVGLLLQSSIKQAADIRYNWTHEDDYNKKRVKELVASVKSSSIETSERANADLKVAYDEQGALTKKWETKAQNYLKEEFAKIEKKSAEACAQNVTRVKEVCPELKNQNMHNAALGKDYCVWHRKSKDSKGKESDDIMIQEVKPKGTIRNRRIIAGMLVTGGFAGLWLSRLRSTPQQPQQSSK